MTLESTIERRLRRRVMAAGGVCIKLAPIDAGTPDRLVLLPWGQIWLVELKAPGGRVEPIQKVWHDRAARIGVPVAVLWSGEQVDQWVRDRIDG